MDTVGDDDKTALPGPTAFAGALARGQHAPQQVAARHGLGRWGHGDGLRRNPPKRQPGSCEGSPCRALDEPPGAHPLSPGGIRQKRTPSATTEQSESSTTTPPTMARSFSSPEPPRRGDARGKAPSLGRTNARGRRAVRLRSASRRPCSRAREGDRPPGPQTREHLSDARGPGEGARLRHRPATRAFDGEHRDQEWLPTMGTPAYMAPEQARGLWAEVDARSDLWAVGATMFTLLSGHLVHEGRTTNEHLLSAMTQPAPPLAKVRPRVGGAVAHLVDRALAFEKGKRWPDAARMQEAVRHAYHDWNGKPITTSPRLVVPETVPNRTLSDSAEVAPRLPTTGGPVTKSKGWTNPLRTLHVTSNPAIAAIAAAVVTAIVGAIVWVAATGHTDAPRERPAVAASPGSSSAATEAPATAASGAYRGEFACIASRRSSRGAAGRATPAPRAFAVDALPRLAPASPPASATAPPIGPPPTRTGGLAAPAVKATPAAKRDPLAP